MNYILDTEEFFFGGVSFEQKMLGFEAPALIILLLVDESVDYDDVYFKLCFYRTCIYFLFPAVS